MTNEIQDTPTAPTIPDDGRLFIANTINPEDPNDPSNRLCIMSGDGETMVAINTKTGHFEFGSGVTPQEAAAEFFKWVERYIKNHHCNEIYDPPADGLEAEELRREFETLTREEDVTGDDIQDILDKVDARDSLQVVTTIANLRKRIKELEGTQ